MHNEIKQSISVGTLGATNKDFQILCIGNVVKVKTTV